MRTITGYHRPADLEQALDLIGREDVDGFLISGGTAVVTDDLPVGAEVIDLQSAVPAGIESRDDRVVFGAMTRLQDIVDSDLVPPLLRDLTHREGPSTFRHAATIGGTVAAADWESELLAGLLIYEAQVTVVGTDGAATIDLADLLADRSRLAGGIITEVSVATGGEAAAVRTARTPADTPIVAAAARVVADGFRIAVTGVAATPVLVDDVASLDPPGDFRGSPEYRKHLAATLTKRVVALLGGAA